MQRPLPLKRTPLDPYYLKDLEFVERAWKNATDGKWRAVQLPGFGPMRFIVSESPDAQHYKVVAILENPGSFDADMAIADARTRVPALIDDIRFLIDKVHEIEAELRALKGEPT